MIAAMRIFSGALPFGYCQSSEHMAYCFPGAGLGCILCYASHQEHTNLYSVSMFATTSKDGTHLLHMMQASERIVHFRHFHQSSSQLEDHIVWRWIFQWEPGTADASW